MKVYFKNPDKSLKFLGHYKGTPYKAATVIKLQEVLESKTVPIYDIGAEFPHDTLHFRTKDFNVEWVHECARPYIRYKAIIIEEKADIKMFFKGRL